MSPHGDSIDEVDPRVDRARARRLGTGGGRPRDVKEEVARLAIELPAERVEEGKTDLLHLPGLEEREVGERDPHAARELRKPKSALR